MGLSTIMRHLRETKKELCLRSNFNLENQKVTPFHLAQACAKEGWRCMKVSEGVWIVKSEAAMEEFRDKNEEGTYTEV